MAIVTPFVIGCQVQLVCHSFTLLKIMGEWKLQDS